MSKAWIGFAVAGVFLIAIVSLFIGANNTANGYEQSIIASHDQSRNVLGQYAPKLKEALGVTKIQAKAVEDVITRANESRYGKEGSAASFQWIQEQNPNLDQSNYGKIITLIEAARKDFENAQKDKIDRLRAYRTALGNIPGGAVMKMMGWPTAGFMDKYGAIVTSGHSQDAFNTGTDDGVDLNGI